MQAPAKQPLKALLVSNGIEGLKKLYASTEEVEYDLFELDGRAQLDLEGYDLLIAPNGTDHVALYRSREEIHRFLNQGGMLFCFDGWFTDWIPGHRWVMDNSKKTIDVRYKIHSDVAGLASSFSIGDLNFSHGISGWWACGFIDPAPQAEIFMVDTWERPLLVVDRETTPGLMVLTASGPLADVSYATTDDEKSYQAMSNLYRGLIRLAQAFRASRPQSLQAS